MRAVVNSDSLTVKIMADGLRGRAGLQVEMKGEDGKLFWRYEGETTWKELLDVNDALQVITRQEIIDLLGFEPAELNHVHPIATHVVDGFLSASDKTKLDQIDLTVIDGKMDKPNGNIGQFIDGTGNVQNFPDFPDPIPQVNADWTATVGAARILNKPLLGSAALVNIDHFASAAQGRKADTAVQPADLDVKLDKPNGTVDQFINGLGELANFAEFNQVNADWNATTGAARILNKPLLGSAAFRPISDFASNTHVHAVATDTVDGFMSALDKAKMDTVAEGATANQTDEYLLNRRNHTGTMLQSGVLGLTEELAGKMEIPDGLATDYIDGTGSVRNLPLGHPIFVFASGQSNMAMVPYDANNNFSYESNLHYWNFTGWENNYGTDFRSPLRQEASVAMSFANEVAKNNPASQVYVFNVSFGGTSITAWTENQPIAAGTTVMGNLDRFTAKLAEMGITDWQFDYSLWWQGENDTEQTEAWYTEHFNNWMEMLHARPEYDRYGVRTVIFGIADHPHIAWGGYTEMNYRLRNIAASFGGSGSFVITGNMPESYWADTVHLNANGYYEVGKRAYISATGGSYLGSRFLKDNPITGLPYVNAYALQFPQRPLDFNQIQVQHAGGATLYMYQEGYLSNTLTMTGGTSAGAGTYERRQTHLCRIGSVITFMTGMRWSGHTGTGQMTFNEMPVDNYLGTEIPFHCYVTIGGVAREAVALWRRWTRQIIFFRYDENRALVPLEMAPVGEVTVIGSFIRIPST